MQNCSFSCEVLGTWTIEADVHEHVNGFILFSFHQSGAICTFLSTIPETSVFFWSELQQALQVSR